MIFCRTKAGTLPNREIERAAIGGFGQRALDSAPAVAPSNREQRS
jgi:hypothetical protein